MFTDLVHLTHNFKNLPFTLAKRHPARVCAGRFRAFRIRFEPSKITYDINKFSDFSAYQSMILQMANKVDKVQALRFLHDESLEYRRGLFLIANKKILQISHVIVQESKYFVLCLMRV